MRVEGVGEARIWLENEVVTEFLSTRVTEGIDDMISMVHFGRILRKDLFIKLWAGLLGQVRQDKIPRC